MQEELEKRDELFNAIMDTVMERGADSTVSEVVDVLHEMIDVLQARARLTRLREFRQATS